MSPRREMTDALARGSTSAITLAASRNGVNILIDNRRMPRIRHGAGSRACSPSVGSEKPRRLGGPILGARASCPLIGSIHKPIIDALIARRKQQRQQYRHQHRGEIIRVRMAHQCNQAIRNKRMSSAAGNNGSAGDDTAWRHGVVPSKPIAPTERAAAVDIKRR